MATVASVRAKYEADLLLIPGVVGVGEGRDRIIVYVRDEDAVRRVPSSLEGVPVFVVVTGELRPLG